MALTTLLTEVKARIEATLIANSITGYTVTRGEMPNSPDKVITVQRYPGTAPIIHFGSPGLQYEHPKVQVAVRGGTTDFDGPMDVINTIFGDLVTVQDTLLSSGAFTSGIRMLILKAIHHPSLEARDGSQRCVWRCDFDAKMEYELETALVATMGETLGNMTVAGVGGLPPPILDSAFAYYRLEEASGPRVDFLGNYDLSVASTDQPRVAGKNNFAWAPDTSFGWLENASLALGGSPGISFSVWVANPDASYTQGRYILTEDSGSNTAYTFGIGNWPNPQASFTARNAIASNSSAVSAPINWTSGNWTHLVATWNGDVDGIARVYVNGALSGTPGGARFGTLRNNGVQGIRVGCYTSDNVFPFGYNSYPAYMDELVVFDYDIGAAGALELWNAGAGLYL